jgi:hypothetical protein
MTTKALYPNIEPTLNLSFALTKALDPRITFSRASSGAAYDGKTVAKAEENLLQRSQEFDNAAWSKTNVTVAANAEVAPDGTSTAETITLTGSDDLFNSITVSASSTQTFSVYLKKGSFDWIRVRYEDATGTNQARLWVDLANGVLGTADTIGTATYIASSITSVGNGWYRVSLTGIAGTATSVRVNVCSATADASTTRASVGSTYYIWGAQLEQRSSVTAYTPTTTQPITNYVPVLLSAANNVARFDHNPVTGESLGLLIEEQRTNLFQRSEEFDNAYWGKDNSSVLSNVAIAPDGTLTADKIVEDTANASHYVWRQVTASGDHSLSVYAKAAERGFLAINFFTSGGNRITWFNLTNGTVGTNAAGNTASITPVGNGWYRCTVSRVGGGSGTFHEFRTATADNTQGYTGDGYSGIYIWGAQLEVGAFPTSYIATVASQVTRSADAASMTGANFSSWFRQDEGTLYGETVLNNRPQDFILGSIPASSLANNIFFSLNTATSPRWRVRTDGADQAIINQTITNIVGGSAKLIGTYKFNDFAFSSNGQAAGTDTLGNVPNNVIRLELGYEGQNNVYCNTTIKKLAYYPKRLTNAELQALTQN